MRALGNGGAWRWLIAAVIAACAGGALLGGRLAPPPESLPPSGGTARARIAHRRAEPSTAEVALSTVIWSPVLFAWPSSLGFSRIQPPEWTIGPPVDPPDVPVPSPSALVTSSVPERTATRRASPVDWLDASRLPHRHLPAPASGLHAVHGELPDHAGWPLTAQEAGALPWSALVTIHVAPEGWPASVWVDSADAPAAARSAAAAKIVRWRWPASETTREVIVRLVHGGVAAKERW
ncbi:MAG: hypothetical protein N2652_02795 [Kiritimatiellae bacterium]|nr:hypothetical protein [Kiritimatiellia bacterium]